jgi:putative flippase GtrA
MTTRVASRATRRPPATTWRQLRSFATIGVLSTFAYVALYALLRGVLAATPANAVALLATAVGNTAANRRLTFGVRGRDGLGRHHLGGIVAFAVALAITSASIGMLGVTVTRPSRLLEVAVLVSANVAATGARFLLLRQWIDRRVTGSKGSLATLGTSSGGHVAAPLEGSR